MMKSSILHFLLFALAVFALNAGSAAQADNNRDNKIIDLANKKAAPFAKADASSSRKSPAENTQREVQKSKSETDTRASRNAGTQSIPRLASAKQAKSPALPMPKGAAQPPLNSNHKPGPAPVPNPLHPPEIGTILKPITPANRQTPGYQSFSPPHGALGGAPLPPNRQASFLAILGGPASQTKRPSALNGASFRQRP